MEFVVFPLKLKKERSHVGKKEYSGAMMFGQGKGKINSYFVNIYSNDVV